MSIRYIQTIKENNRLLIRTLDLESGLVDELLCKDVITVAFYDSLQALSPDQRNASLLRMLFTSPDSGKIIPKFVQILNMKEYQQEHVANILLENVNGKQCMSELRFERFMLKLSELREILDPEGGLVVKLLSYGALTRQDKSRISCRKCLDDKAEELIFITSRKSNCSFDIFLAALNETGQEHVVTVLLGHGEKYPIRKEWKEQIVDNRKRIVESMSVENDELLSETISKRVFTEYDQQRIRSGKSNDDQVEILIQILLRKPEYKYVRFTDALHNSNQDHVANLMYGQNLEVELCPEFEYSSQENRENVETELRETLRKTFLQDTRDTCLQENEHVKRCEIFAKENGMSVADVRVGSIILVFRLTTRLDPLSYEDIFTRLSSLFSKAIIPIFSKKQLSSLKFAYNTEDVDNCNRALSEVSLRNKQYFRVLRQTNKLLTSMSITTELMALLSRRNRLAIHAVAALEEQIRLFLSMIGRTSQTTYDKFIEALRNSGQVGSIGILEEDHHTPSTVLSASWSLSNSFCKQISSSLDTLKQIESVSFVERDHCNLHPESISNSFNSDVHVPLDQPDVKINSSFIKTRSKTTKKKVTVKWRRIYYWLRSTPRHASSSPVLRSSYSYLRKKENISTRPVLHKNPSFDSSDGEYCNKKEHEEYYYDYKSDHLNQLYFDDELNNSPQPCIYYINPDIRTLDRPNKIKRKTNTNEPAMGFTSDTDSLSSAWSSDLCTSLHTDYEI